MVPSNFFFYINYSNKIRTHAAAVEQGNFVLQSFNRSFCSSFSIDFGVEGEVVKAFYDFFSDSFSKQANF